MKKYKLTNNKKKIFGKTLYQIESLINFGDIHVGDKGGWIEKETNLSQCGNAWVYGDARVYGNALVYCNARVYGNAWVYGNALVYGDARVYGNALVYGNAEVYGNALVYGDARVYGNALVYGNAEVYGNAWVYGDAEVCDNAEVYDNAEVLWISKIGSRLRTTTAFWNKDKGISIACGCFRGTLKEFDEKVKQTHGGNKFAREYNLLIELIKVHFEVEE